MAYEDLIKDTSQSFENGNYFIVTITDLDVNQPYPVQFRWKNKDGSFSKWGAAKTLITPGESDPATPRLQSANVVGGAGYLSVTWDGKNSSGADLINIDRVDIYIDGSPFDGTKPTDNFKVAGTKTFTAPAGSYTVILVAVSKLGTLSPTSSAITKTVTSIANPIATPQDPYAPTITTGLASIVVSWNGKKSDGNNFTAGAFAGAKIYIGTTSGFTPSSDNWVHSLNFANGTNQVSIGVGTVINKTSGAKLEYGTPYYIKLRTVNSEGTETSTAVASSPTNITVDKLPASEIKTGILAADASITAGASGGSRVVMSGAPSPFIIYGTDGSTALLEFIGGSTGTLAIKGSSTFSGSISIGSGNDIFKADPTVGIWLGNASESSAPFSVAKNGVIRATSGTIGGWYLGSSYLQNASSSPTLRLGTGGIIVGATSSSYIDIAPDSITHRNSNGTASGKFTLTTGSSPSLTVNGSITASTFSLSGSNGDAWSSSGSFQFGGSAGIKYSGSGNLTIGSSGNTVTIDTSTGAVTVANITATQFSIDSNNYWNSTGFKVGNGTNRLEYVSSTGALTVNGQISRDSYNYWNDTGFRAGDATSYLRYVASSSTLTVTGKIQADTGYVGGWTIDSNGFLKNGTTYLYGSYDDPALTEDVSIADLSRGAYFKSVYAGSGGFFSSNGGDYYATSGQFFTVSGNIGTGTGNINAGIGTTTLYSDGSIYANTLGVYTGASAYAVRQVYAGGSGTSRTGFLRVNTSSRKFKKNIEPLVEGNYMNLLTSLKPVSYLDRNEEEGSPRAFGLIAEEVAEILELKDGLVPRDADGNPGAVNYELIGVLSLMALKEIKAKLESMENRLDALEG
jgi:hypothetical protein